MKSNKAHINRVCIPADLSQLAVVRDFVEANATKAGFDETQVYKMTLAVDEACSNLIRHSFAQDNSQNICVEIEFCNPQFKIIISDNGVPFNPLEFATPNMTEYLNKFKRGGLGIHIIKSVMDDVLYSSGNNQNTLILTKNFQSAS